MTGNFICDTIHIIQHLNLPAYSIIFIRTQWLYDDSDVIYPSVYMSEKIKAKDRAAMVRGRVREAVRLARNARGRDREVIVYYRYLFTDTRRFLSQVSNRTNSLILFVIFI